MTIIHNYLKKNWFFLFSFIAASYLLVGCQKQPTLTFGSTYVSDNNNANIVLVDTSTAVMSTVFIDSTATAGTGFLLIGNYKDTYFGSITSRAFLQVTPPASLPELNPRFDTYDSIGIILRTKKANPFYGDTTIPQTLAVSQVDTLYQLPTFSHGFFSNSSLKTSATTLGSTTVRIAPNIPYTSQGTGDTIRIRLNDALGQRLYNMIYNKSDSIIKPAIWLNWFHGLCISPGPGSSGAIYGFDVDSSFMRIYYRENGVPSVQKYIDFKIGNNSQQFNSVRADRTGTPLEHLVKPTQSVQPPSLTPSGATGNAAYLQSITGLTVKLTFPYMNGIVHRPDYISVLRAQLTVRPVPGSFTTTWRLPPQISLYATDQSNVPLAPIIGTTTAGAQNGNLVLDYFHPLNTEYTYDVTNFIKEQITNTSPTAPQTGFLLTIPAPANTNSFARAILSDPTYPVNQRVTLSIYYIALYPHQ